MVGRAVRVTERGAPVRARERVCAYEFERAGEGGEACTCSAAIIICSPEISTRSLRLSSRCSGSTCSTYATSPSSVSWMDRGKGRSVRLGKTEQHTCLLPLPRRGSPWLPLGRCLSFSLHSLSLSLLSLSCSFENKRERGHRLSTRLGRQQSSLFCLGTLACSRFLGAACPGFCLTSQFSLSPPLLYLFISLPFSSLSPYSMSLSLLTLSPSFPALRPPSLYLPLPARPRLNVPHRGAHDLLLRCGECVRHHQLVRCRAHHNLGQHCGRRCTRANCAHCFLPLHIRTQIRRTRLHS